LLIYIIEKFIFTALTLSCPIPGGIFTPTFALGAVTGQLYVSVLIKIIQFFGFSGDII
jgi:H+/Cl- antiporter ClcA